MQKCDKSEKKCTQNHTPLTDCFTYVDNRFLKYNNCRN